MNRSHAAAPLALLALLAGACVDSIGEGEAGACTTRRDCPPDNECTGNACVPRCETDTEACNREEKPCGQANDLCNDAEVACSQVVGLCGPGQACSAGACCATDCSLAACGAPSCDGDGSELCRGGCAQLRQRQEASYGDPVWPAQRPRGRAGAAFAVDPASGRGLLFGGKTRTPIGTNTDPYELDGDSWWLEPDGVTWTPIPLLWSAADPTKAPSPRLNARLTFDEEHGLFLLFGGELTEHGAVTTQFSQELWSFDGVEWRELHPAGAVPDERQLHAFVYDPRAQEVVLLGGTTNGLPLADQWRYRWDALDGGWEKLPQEFAGPVRSGATLTPVSGGLLLHAGRALGTPAAPQNDSWLWDGASWSALPPTLDGTPREQACAVPLPGDRVLIAGGENDPAAENAIVLDLAARKISLLAGTFTERANCFAGPVGGVATVGYGIDGGKNPDDLWQLEER